MPGNAVMCVVLMASATATRTATRRIAATAIRLPDLIREPHRHIPPVTSHPHGARVGTCARRHGLAHAAGRDPHRHDRHCRRPRPGASGALAASAGTRRRRRHVEPRRRACPPPPPRRSASPRADLLAFALVACALALFTRWQSQVTYALEHEYVARWRKQLYRAVFRQPMDVPRAAAPSDIAHVLTTDLQKAGIAAYQLMSLAATAVVTARRPTSPSGLSPVVTRRRSWPRWFRWRSAGPRLRRTARHGDRVTERQRRRARSGGRASCQRQDHEELRCRRPKRGHFRGAGPRGGRRERRDDARAHQPARVRADLLGHPAGRARAHRGACGRDAWRRPAGAAGGIRRASCHAWPPCTAER